MTIFTARRERTIRQMDIDRAIHIVRNRACTECDSSNSDWDCSECDEALTLAVKGLELLKEQQPKWIPINERKPNSCGTYIVARWFIDGCRRKILTDACYFDGSNTWHDDTRVNHSRPYLTDKIVAWMPLPNPPKDGEQE